MTTKHTPAPWLVDGAGTNWTVYGLNDQGYNRFSAQIQRGNTAPMEHTGSDEIAANALLIAAAPELLVALEGVLRVADRATVEFDAARAAIRKAKGEQV